jgi:hypothetical protein
MGWSGAAFVEAMEGQKKKKEDIALYSGRLWFRGREKTGRPQLRYGAATVSCRPSYYFRGSASLAAIIMLFFVYGIADDLLPF